MSVFYPRDKSVQTEMQDCKSPSTTGMEAILFNIQ